MKECSSFYFTPFDITTPEPASDRIHQPKEKARPFHSFPKLSETFFLNYCHLFCIDFEIKEANKLFIIDTKILLPKKKRL